MLSWRSNKESNQSRQAAPVMKKPAVSSIDSEWYSPNESLAGMEVKELSIAEFMAVYKPQLNKG